jgi:response regulator RpfG family c-di-GMP phosphodiesterase
VSGPGPGGSARLVVVDDDPSCLESVCAYLEDSGFSVSRARDGREGLAAVERESPDLVLLDLQMPGLHGLEVLAAVRERSPATPVVVFSGSASVADVVRALRLGASDYLIKPVIDLEILEHSVRVALERARLLRERDEYQQRLEREIQDRTRELRAQLAQRLAAETQLRESFDRLERVLDETVETLVAVVETKDPHTSGHQRRVVQLAAAIAVELGLSAHRIRGHVDLADVVQQPRHPQPAEILSRPGQLRQSEIDLLRSHPSIGYELLKGIPFEWPVADIVLQHHERIDGSGYPSRLHRDEIMQEARILAVADVVEALSSHRPYRPALGLDRALAEIASARGVLYDECVVDACLRLFREKGFAFRTADGRPS